MEASLIPRLLPCTRAWEWRLASFPDSLSSSPAQDSGNGGKPHSQTPPLHKSLGMEASLIPRLLPCTRAWEWRLASFPDSLSSSPAQDSGNGGKPHSQTPPLHKSLGMEASLIPRLSFLLPCTRVWEWRLASFPDSLSSSPAQDSGNGGKPHSQTPPLHKTLGMEASLIPRLLPCTRLWEWRLASFPDSLSSSPAQDSGNGGKPHSQTPPLHKSLGMEASLIPRLSFLLPCTRLWE